MRRTMTALVVVALMAGGVIAQQPRQQDIDLQAAIRTETVNGDLNAAIKQYTEIVSKYTSDRAIVASALIRMADCYQRLGDAQSRAIYERVVREFADRPDEVALARARLGSEPRVAASAGMTTRRLWTTPQGTNRDFLTGATISPDGRLVSFTDWNTGNLMVHEFATGLDRRLTNAPDPYDRWAEESAISRDGKQIAYSWFHPDKSRYELHVASLEGTGVPQSRVLLDNADIEFVFPTDWSPDGAWIALHLTRADKTDQMALVSVRDGSLRVLKSSEWSGSTELFFSPDGKHLGFDARIGETSGAPRDVFILAIDGSRQVTAVTGPSNDTMMGWSPDGNSLVFASDRGGSTGLWRIAIADGNPRGAPELVKADISRFSLGLSASGSLYTGVSVGDREIHVAQVDLATGRLLAPPARPLESFVGTNAEPSWSPDGRYLAYRSNRPPPVYNAFLGIQAVEGRQVREVQPKLTYFQNIRWEADGRSFLVGGKDLKGRQGQYRVDAQTGDVTPVAGQPSRVGQKSYVRRAVGAEGFAFVELDAASGTEREIIRRKDLGGMFLAPDGRSIAARSYDTSTKTWTVLAIPIQGGEPRALLQVTEPQSLGSSEWTPDSRAVLVTKGLINGGTRANELWMLPIAGGQPRRIDIGATAFEQVKLNPDGRHVAYVAGDRIQEVWVLENFLPALNRR